MKQVFLAMLLLVTTALAKAQVILAQDVGQQGTAQLVPVTRHFVMNGVLYQTTDYQIVTASQWSNTLPATVQYGYSPGYYSYNDGSIINQSGYNPLLFRRYGQRYYTSTRGNNSLGRLAWRLLSGPTGQHWSLCYE